MIAWIKQQFGSSLDLLSAKLDNALVSLGIGSDMKRKEGLVMKRQKKVEIRVKYEK